MGWRRRAGGGRRDASEVPIVAALEALGASVWKLGGTGNPDLLVRYQGLWTPLEVKGTSGSLTRNQQALSWPVVRTVHEACAAIGMQMRETR